MSYLCKRDIDNKFFTVYFMPHFAVCGPFLVPNNNAAVRRDLPGSD